MKNIYKDLKKQLSSETYEFLKVITYRSYQLYGKDYFCDICVVRDINRRKTFIRLQKRWHGLSKKMKKDGEKKPRWIVIKSYNFPQKFEFERARAIFNRISKGEVSDREIPREMTATGLAVEELKKLNKRLKKLRKVKRKNKRNKEEILKLKEQITFLDEENRALKKDRIVSQIPEYRKTIKETISSLDTQKEHFFQKQFTKNAWIFGPSYDQVVPKKKADPENQPDFILKRYDGFCDVVEIEQPNLPLFTKPDKSGKSQATSLLTHAISQAMDYIDSYNEKFKELFYRDAIQEISTIPIHAYYPKGIVIMGRDKNTDRKKLRQLNNFLHNIIVLTYDEFLKQSDRMLDMLKKV